MENPSPEPREAFCKHCKKVIINGTKTCSCEACLRSWRHKETNRLACLQTYAEPFKNK